MQSLLNIRSFLLRAKSVLLCLITFCTINSNAQDIHFSQYDASPLNLNPALTGFFNGTVRVFLNHRNQWASVTVPYLTFSGGFDLQLYMNKYSRNAFSLGILANADKAGDSKYGTVQGMLSLSYMQSLNRKNTDLLSLGVSAGLSQRTIDYTKLFFDKQFNGSYFDPTMYNSENFQVNSFLFYDINAGLYWNYMWADNQTIDAGIAVFHINTPGQSLMKNSSVKLSRKWVLFTNPDIGLGEKLDIIPALMVSLQGSYMEIIYGFKTIFSKDKKYFERTTFGLGIYSRHNDALIVSAGIEYKGFTIGLSYDVNYSDLNNASNYRGGYEIALKYIYSKRKHKRIKEIPCPIF